MQKKISPFILDACCGGKMFWFDKENSNVLFQDRRIVEPTKVGKGKNERVFSCQPDVLGDFRSMEYKNETFKLVVFDPPHLTSLGKNSYMAVKYGRLDKLTWQQDLQKGFNESFRVLEYNGILIFKWNEFDIKLKDVLKLSPYRPLFGHPSGKAMKTHWVCFMKINENLLPRTTDK